MSIKLPARFVMGMSKVATPPVTPVDVALDLGAGDQIIVLLRVLVSDEIREVEFVIDRKAWNDTLDVLEILQ